MSTTMMSPRDMMTDIAKRAQESRLRLNLSQQTLSARSGVSYGTLKKFERTGQISLESLLKIALALDELEKFDDLFKKNPDLLPATLDELLEETTGRSGRKRGRK